jgi:hypothetical protein
MSSIEFLHVRFLYELDESQRRNVTDKSQEEDSGAPGDEHSSPDASKTNNTFRVV